MYKSTSLTFALVFSFCQFVYAQAYDDYIGAGHNRDIIVTGSDNLQQTGWSQTASAEKTINGEGLEGKLSEAARFLNQATLCYDMEEIELVAENGLEAWIDAQIAQDMILYEPMLQDIMGDYHAYQFATGDTLQHYPHPVTTQFQKTAYWRMNLQNRDFLRDKIVGAWLEILVISIASDIGTYGYGVMNYLDIFKRHAFGNFRDILQEISLHTSMGTFLSHYGNPKANPAANTLPDENFAREVMQLFTIGLHELNNDGTPVTNPDGSFIPTYDNEDIGEMAKVFTGLGSGGTISPNLDTLFWNPIWGRDYTIPMKMYEDKHEPSIKTLFDGDLVIPANQPGMQDITMALDYLFNHKNTPPFICYRLIQLFVKSNPTPAYVNRVVNVFIDDGNGTRGNMAATVKAILLDEEARSCDWQMHPDQGKFRPATEKGFQFARIAEVESETGEIWTDASYQTWTAGHIPMAAPSVFNHHQRDFAPFGEIQDAGLVAPEFQIFDSHTSIGYVNMIWRWFFLWEEYGYGTWRDPTWKMHPSYDNFLESGQDPEVLLNILDMRLTNGNMTPYTRERIKHAISGLDPSQFPSPIAHLGEYELEKVKLAFILILMSPDFHITK